MNMDLIIVQFWHNSFKNVNFQFLSERIKQTKKKTLLKSLLKRKRLKVCEKLDKYLIIQR